MPARRWMWSATINRAGAESWLLEYGADVNPDRWIAIGERRSVDGAGSVAATWETILLSGIHTLRLTVDFADGSRLTDSKLLTFDNTPPAVKLGANGGAEARELPWAKWSRSWLRSATTWRLSALNSIAMMHCCWSIAIGHTALSLKPTEAGRCASDQRAGL